MSPIIRLAQIQDRRAVEAIVEAAYTPYIRRIGQKPGPMSDDYDALIREGRVHVLIDDGVIEGILVLIPEVGSMLLDNIAVSPAAQGRGHGRTLLQFAESTARAAHHASIRLYTNQAMTENITLYSRIGFTETHRAEEKGLRRVYMTKRLDP